MSAGVRHGNVAYLSSQVSLGCSESAPIAEYCRVVEEIAQPLTPLLRRWRIALSKDVGVTTPPAPDELAMLRAIDPERRFLG